MLEQKKNIQTKAAFMSFRFFNCFFLFFSEWNLKKTSKKNENAAKNTRENTLTKKPYSI
jgi:hypothetical protein